jgi:hypothetical protein
MNRIGITGCGVSGENLFTNNLIGAPVTDKICAAATW